MTAQNGGLYYLSLAAQAHNEGSQKGKARARPMTTQNGVLYYFSHGAEPHSKGSPKGKAALEPIESIHQ